MTENALSVISNMDLQAVTGTMNKIGQFQGMVRNSLRENQDYGRIPGTPKPTLLKPGAEKILMLLGMRSTFGIVDSTRDFDKGFFQYQVKCSLYSGDTLITEGLGAANNREKKWAKMDPYTADNTILKMARKRALVDAALTVGSLSDLFTQDLDDLDLNGNAPEKRVFTDQDGTISTAQAKRMFALSKGNADIVKKVLTEAGYERSEQVKKTEYEELCNKVEALANGDVVVDAEAVPVGDPPPEVDPKGFDAAKEMFGGEEKKPEEKKPAKKANDKVISEAQKKRMFALAKGNADLVKSIAKSAGFERPDDVIRSVYEGLCAEIEEQVGTVKVEESDVPF